MLQEVTEVQDGLEKRILQLEKALENQFGMEIQETLSSDNKLIDRLEGFDKSHKNYDKAVESILKKLPD